MNKICIQRVEECIIKEGLGVTIALSSDKCKIDVPLIVYHQGKIYHHNNFYGIFVPSLGNFTIRDDDAMQPEYIHKKYFVLYYLICKVHQMF